MSTEATLFLERFNYDKITLAFLHKTKKTKIKVVTLDEFKEREEEYHGLNEKGYEVFFMVNEGDGETTGKGSTVRNQEAVIRLSALYLDTDECPVQDVAKYLKKIKLKPHIVVNTSAKRYHYYFLLRHLKPTVANLANWRACQKSLMYLGDSTYKQNGCDTSMTDHSKLLRVPGFNHLKQDPFLVNVKKETDNEPYYLDELVHQLNAPAFFKKETKVYQLPKGQIEEGGRHYALTSIVGTLVNRDIEPELVHESVLGIVQRKFDNPEMFLPGGKRYEEVERAINYAIEQRNRSLILENTESFKQSDDNPFALEDEFFLNAPGMAGEIVREIYDRAHYQCASIIFSTVVGMLGTLKSHHVSPSGLTPSNYFVCLADTGAGKNYPQDVIKATFKELDITRYLSTRMRTAQGFYDTLQRGRGRVLLLYDESEEFFKGIQADNRQSSSWVKECQPLLLQLYTSTNTAYLDTGDAKTNKRWEFDFPCFNMIAYGVIDALGTAFNLSSVTRGLMSRCLLVVHNTRERHRNPKEQKAGPLNGHIEQYLREKVTIMEDFFNKNRDERTNRPLQLIPYEEGVAEMIAAFQDKLDFKYNELARNSQHQLKGLYTRGVEQVIRVALALSEDIVTKEVLRYSTLFVESRIEATVAMCSDNFTSNELSKNLKTLTSTIAEINHKTKEPAIKKDLYGNLPLKLRNSKDLHSLLKSAVDAEMIKEVKHGRTVGYILDDVITQ